MKRKTAKASELIKRLQVLIDEVGDLPVFVMHATADFLVVGNKVDLNGLSKEAQVMQVDQTGTMGMLVFQSDESIKLI